MKSLSHYALEQMLNLYHRRAGELSSQQRLINPALPESARPTGCITYALNVLSYAYNKADKVEAAAKVWELGKHGADLAAYLVTRQAWKGIYIKPDIVPASDNKTEAAYSNLLAARTGQYYNVPLCSQFLNQRPGLRDKSASFQLHPKHGLGFLDEVEISSLQSLRFGFGISKGGMHTWLFSRGDVYQVHCADNGTVIYEKRALQQYPWLNGVIVVPPDQVTQLTAVAHVHCR